MDEAVLVGTVLGACALLACALLLADLLRQTRKQIVRLRYYLHDARQLLQRHVRLCHRCQGLGYLLVMPSAPDTESRREPCPRCSRTQAFLDQSAGR